MNHLIPYEPFPIWNVCYLCSNYKSKNLWKGDLYGAFPVNKNRCKVRKKTPAHFNREGTCSLWTKKQGK